MSNRDYAKSGLGKTPQLQDRPTVTHVSNTRYTVPKKVRGFGENLEFGRFLEFGQFFSFFAPNSRGDRTPPEFGDFQNLGVRRTLVFFVEFGGVR